MATITEIVAALEKVNVKVTDKFLTLLSRNITLIFKEMVGPEVKARLLNVYDRLASQEAAEMGGDISGSDPTRLEANRGLFEAQLDKELSTIGVVGNQIVISFMSRDLLGFNDSSPRKGGAVSVDWLHYYINGIAGEFAFITAAHKKQKNPRSTRSLGRFSEGFLISKEDYISEEWEEITGKTFSAVRHSISGQRPFDDFERVANGIDYNKFIQMAIEKTLDEGSK